MSGIDRLRAIAGAWDEWGLGGELADIADQIEREQGEHVSRMRVLAVVTEMERHVSGVEGAEDSPVARWARELRRALKSDTSDSAEQQKPSWHDHADAAGVTSEAAEVTRYPAEDVSMSACDLLPEDEREAIAWVREHGGMDAVRRRWECLSCYADPVPRSCMEKRLARLQRQIDESHAALRRRNERIGFLVSELNRTNDENHEEFMRRAGDYEAFADEVCERLASELRHVEGCPKDVMDAALEALDRRLMPEGMEWPRYESGELVEVGDGISVTVHDEDGDFERTMAAESVSFDGHGVIIGDSRHVVRLLSGERVRRPESKCRDCAHWQKDPAADGEPIKKGEHVFGPNGGQYRVTSAHDGKVFARYVNGPFGAEVESAGGEGLYRLRADQLTHTKPEPPDSAERIADEIDRLREEVALHLGDYLYDEDGNDSIQFSMELVAKRCRALAERERGE